MSIANPRSFHAHIPTRLANNSERKEKIAAKALSEAWLRKKFPADARAIALAEKLESCDERARCLSPACPHCAAAARRFFAKTLSRSLPNLAGGKPIVMVSIVPADGIVMPGQLSAELAKRLVRRWRDRLARAGIDWFVGALDFSFNESSDDEFQAHWSIHFYGVTSCDDVKDLKRCLLKSFPRSDIVLRPVKVKVWDERIQALRYVLKDQWVRRISYADGKRHDRQSGESRQCRVTTKDRLRSRHRLELLLVLDELGQQRRFLMRCVQFGVMQDRARFRPTS